MADIVGGSIVWNLDIDNKNFNKGIDDANSKVKSLGDNSTSIFSGIKQSLENAEASSQKFLTGIVGIGIGIAGALGYGIKYAANLETMTQGFVTLLGSTTDADAAIKMIQKDAASTPFNFSGLVQDNELLTSITHNAQDSERILLDVGKALTAMGKGQPELDRILINLQQIGAVGHASMIDIKQFAFAGIPIYDMLKNQLKVTGDQLNTMISNGQITFDIVKKTFEAASEGTGKYAQAFILQGGTLNQLWSNFIDNLGIVSSSMVKQLGTFDLTKTYLGQITTAIGKLATPEGIKNIEHFISILKDNLPIITGIIIGGVTPAIYGMVAAFMPLIPFVAIGAAIGIAFKLLNDRFDLLGKGLPVLIGLLAAVGAIVAMVVVPAFIAWTAAAVPAAIATVAATWPFLAVGAAVGIVVAGIVLLIQHWKQVTTFLSGEWKSISTATVAGINQFVYVIKGLAAVFVDFFTGGDITATWYQYFKTTFMGIAIFFDNFRNTIFGIGAVIKDFFTGGDVTATWYEYFKTTFINIAIILNNVQRFFIELPGNIIKEIQALPQQIANILIKSALGFVEFIGFSVGIITIGIPKLVSLIVAFFTALPGKIMNVLNELATELDNIWINISTSFIATWNSILNWAIINIPLMINSIINFFVTLPAKIALTIVAVYNGVVTGWNNIWNWITITVQKMITDVIGFFMQLPGRIMSVLNNTKDTATTGFQDIWTAIVTEVSSWPDKIFQWGANIANAFVDGIKSAIGAIVGAFEDGLNKAKKLIEGHSPPLEGPFKDIDKWGFNVGNAWVQGVQSAIGSLSLPNSSIGSINSLPSGSGYNSNTISNSITNAPVLNVNLGIYAGTESEKRKIAKELYDAYIQYQKGRGK